MVRPCHGELGPFCWPMLAADLAVFSAVHLVDLLSTLLRCNGFAGIQKAVMDQTGSRPPNSNHDIFWWKFSLGSALELLLCPTTELVIYNLVVIYNPLFIACHNLIKKQFIAVVQNKTTLQNNDFLICSSWGTHLSNFFTFTICFKCQMTVEWLTLSSQATTHVVVRGSVSMIALSWLLSTSYGRPLHSSPSKLLSPLQNFLNHHCTIHLLAVPGPNALLILCVVSIALQAILNLNKKIAQICFLSNIISIV